MDHGALEREQVQRLARLCRLDAPDHELDDLAARLAAVLGYVARLDALNLDGVLEMPHVGDETNVLGEDRPGPQLDRQTLLDLSPQIFDCFVRVPKVLGEGGGA
ncbi:MAG: Asp-tRNA(Asn)/Glu-tRNA(Gln) amidotransferase subunit GatC [Phycisphaerales bacterium]|nr:Asp-tRNA(Asn)/Glu-tRNA(Gln) amidotransferase subunit GatC [Phycisphaerales bacterium]